MHLFSLLQSEGVANAEYKSSLERDNAELRSTVARQSQRVGQLEKKSPRDDDKLQEIIKLQHDKIQYYQQEIEQSKQDMLRLESLVQRVQEERHIHAPLVGNQSSSFSYLYHIKGYVKEANTRVNLLVKKRKINFLTFSFA